MQHVYKQTHTLLVLTVLASWNTMVQQSQPPEEDGDDLSAIKMN